MSEGDIVDYDAGMRERNPGCDTFFTSSAACDGGISEKTLRNLQSVDSTLGFIKCSPDGRIATCAQSMQAWAQHRREVRQISSPRYPFDGGFSLSTDCSSGSAPHITLP